MFLKSTTRRISLLALLALAPSTFLSAMDATKQVSLEKEGTELIGQVEDVAHDICYNADRLHSFNNHTRVSNWTHYHHLEQIKSLVNNGLQPALSRLTEIQPQLPAWKQQAIDQMLASANALAADTNAAILNKNENRTVPTPLNAEYTKTIKRINDHAENLVKTSDAAGDFANAHLKATEAGIPVHTQ